MKNLLILYKEWSWWRLERLIDKDLVKLEGDKFIYIKDGSDVENLKLKTQIESEESINLEDSDCSYTK